MAKSSLNAVEIVRQAWRLKRSISPKKYAERTSSLLHSSFVGVENAFKNLCLKSNVTYKNEIITFYQRYCAYVLTCDRNLTLNEYNVYEEFINFTEFVPLTFEQIISIKLKATSDSISSDAFFIRNIRPALNPKLYADLVTGLCMLALIGNNAFDQGEFYIIGCLFENGFDFCPSSWEEFKSHFNY